MSVAIAATVARSVVRASRPPVEGILGAIGDTPLVALRRLLGRDDLLVWGKLEMANPGGSAKDRSATAMIDQALTLGLVGPESTVIESSSGNLGVGLAQACRYLGLRLIVVVDVRTSEKSVRTMRALGADVRVVSYADTSNGDLLAARLKLVRELNQTIQRSFWPNQYANQANPRAHAVGTMREIDDALNGELDYLFVATSTTGTLRGCYDYLRDHARSTHLVAVDALGSALFGGTRGPRLLPGLGAGVSSALSREAHFDTLVRVSDLDCVVGCHRLVNREAIFSGASSGGVAYALEALSLSMPFGSRCAAIFADGGAGYLDTVYDEGWVDDRLGCTGDRLAALVA
jgi:cysteine synthase A